jgi:hypothetical protein
MLYHVTLGHALRVQSWIQHQYPAYFVSLTLIKHCACSCVSMYRQTSRTHNPQYPQAIIYLAFLDLGFSGQCLWRLLFSGKWHRVVWWKFTNVSEERVASDTKRLVRHTVEPEDGSGTIETSVNFYQTMLRHVTVMLTCFCFWYGYIRDDVWL